MEYFINSTKVINIKTSLHKLIEGGTPMLIANSKKQIKMTLGTDLKPLFIEITRECLEL